MEYLEGGPGVPDDTTTEAPALIQRNKVVQDDDDGMSFPMVGGLVVGLLVTLG